jgi:hypothetical protein
MKIIMDIELYGIGIRLLVIYQTKLHIILRLQEIIIEY